MMKIRIINCTLLFGPRKFRLWNTPNLDTGIKSYAISRGPTNKILNFDLKEIFDKIEKIGKTKIPDFFYLFVFMYQF